MASPNPEPERCDSHHAAAQWAIAWERQIILEILRDTEPTREVTALVKRVRHREIRNVQPAFPSPQQLAAKAMERCVRELNATPSGLNDSPRESWFAESIEKELNESLAILETEGRDALYDRLELLIQPEVLFLDPTGDLIESNADSSFWGMWYPGLENDDCSMQEILQTLPGVAESAIPQEVHLFENPKSAIALPGAVSLEWHDAIHILLGRGLLDQDEAFVIGFTMGNASAFREEDATILRNALCHTYPEPFRVHGGKLLAFDLGVEAGRMIGVPDLADQNGRFSNQETLRSWRQHFGIDKEMLRSFYARENLTIPRTLESARLPLEVSQRRKTPVIRGSRNET